MVYVKLQLSNSPEPERLQPLNNAMIIKLQDSDITTAQDDPDDEGVIHVPDNVWDHVIKEIEHPEQRFINSLYLDVKDLSIGGSGLPLMLYSFDFDDNVRVNTYDMTLKEIGVNKPITVPNGYSFFDVIIYDGYSTIYFYHNSTGNNIELNLGSQNRYRYYLSPNTVNTQVLNLYDSEGNRVFSVSDQNQSDYIGARFLFNTNIIDFLWLTS